MFHAAPICAASWPSVPAPNGVRPMRFSWRMRSLTIRVCSIRRYMPLTSSRLRPSVSWRARAVTVMLAMVPGRTPETGASTLRERAAQRLGGRVAAADPARHALAHQPLRHAARGSDGCGARALRDDMPLNEQEPHRVVELVVGNEDEVVEESGEHRLRQVE